MPELVILGSSNAIPDETHENTHLALIGEKRRALIDCVGNPVVRLKQAGIALNSITDLFLTHFHPDHVSGAPPLLVSMWLLGRRAPLNIYGLSHTLDRFEKMMTFYDWENWRDFFPVTFHHLPNERMTLALASAEFRVFTSPVCHMVPTIGLRIEAIKTGCVLTYSCDTAPCEEVVELAAKAEVLIHEATGAFPGHSSAAQAGQVAAQAQVEKLYLIHYDPQAESLVGQAQKEFPAPVILAEDFMRIEF